MKLRPAVQAHATSLQLISDELPCCNFNHMLQQGLQDAARLADHAEPCDPAAFSQKDENCQTEVTGHIAPGKSQTCRVERIAQGVHDEGERAKEGNEGEDACIE